jgi:hypothetical protein
MMRDGQFTDNRAKSPSRLTTSLALAHITSIESLRNLVGAVGIEPTTFGLKGRCSTTELRP